MPEPRRHDAAHGTAPVGAGRVPPGRGGPDIYPKLIPGELSDNSISAIREIVNRRILASGISDQFSRIEIDPFVRAPRIIDRMGRKRICEGISHDFAMRLTGAHLACAESEYRGDYEGNSQGVHFVTVFLVGLIESPPISWGETLKIN